MRDCIIDTQLISAADIDTIQIVAIRLREIGANLAVLVDAISHNPACKPYYGKAVMGLEAMIFEQAKKLEQVAKNADSRE